MKRKFYDLMLSWKRTSGGRTALMIDGARRVGKSYIAEEFARREYDDYLLIDFSKVKPKVKRYLADTGLLVSMAFDESRLQAEDIHSRILSERIEFNEGMLVENVVAQMLLAAGHRPYFYSNADRRDSANRMEIDFLLDKSTLTRRHNVSSVEVKSGANITHSSLDKFRAKFKSNLAESYLLSDRDLKVNGGITYLPLYMTPLLVNEKSKAEGEVRT